MGRPKKSYRWKRNGNNVQVVHEGVFLAEFTPAEMIELAKWKKRIGSTGFLADLLIIKNGGVIMGTGRKAA